MLMCMLIYYNAVNESERLIPDNFVPFGTANGDSIVPRFDDGSSDEIRLDRDVFIFGLNHSRIYVS